MTFVRRVVYCVADVGNCRQDTICCDYLRKGLRNMTLKGNAIIGQSGGPTAVINASLVGAVHAARESTNIDRIYGMRYAIEGFMDGKLVDLGAQSDDVLEQLRWSPSSALGSSRHKLQDGDFDRILKVLQVNDIRYVFMIGGNDTMDTIHRLEAFCTSNGYQMRGVGIPKTVDNDLYGVDHTPGFPSAAMYVALSVQQAGMLARDMQKVDQFVIFQTVGRSAGWLPAAAALAKQNDDDAPHIILVPEVPFDADRFFARVEQAYQQYGFVSIVCGEGITYADGTPVSASQTTDRFANVEFGAMGGTSAAMMLHKLLADKFGWRGEFQVTESLQMCAADRGVAQDYETAYQCGRRAVTLADEGTSGVMVAIRCDRSGEAARIEFDTVPLDEVAVRARPMPDEYYDADRLYVTDAFLEYVRPLVGSLPHYARLADLPT